MELTPSIIYLIMQADSIRPGVVMFTILLCAGACLAMVTSASYRSSAEISKKYDQWKEDAERETRLAGNWLRAAIYLIPVIVVFFVSAVLMPSTKTLVAMYGIPATIEAARSAELDETAKKSIKAVNKLLDSYLEGKE